MIQWSIKYAKWGKTAGINQRLDGAIFRENPGPFFFLLMFPRKREEIYKYLERTYAAIGQLLLSLLFSDVPVDFAVVVF